MRIVWLEASILTAICFLQVLCLGICYNQHLAEYGIFLPNSCIINDRETIWTKGIYISLSRRLFVSWQMSSYTITHPFCIIILVQRGSMDIFWKRDQSDLFYCISTICWKSSKETIGDGDSIDDSSSWNILYELALFHWEG